MKNYKKEFAPKDEIKTKEEPKKETPPADDKKDYPKYQEPTIGKIILDAGEKFIENEPPPPPEVKKEEKEIFTEFDKQDSEQIAQELKNGIIKGEYVYTDKKEDEEGNMVPVYGFSYKGVVEMMKRQGDLEVVGQPFPEHSHIHFTYTVTCKNTKDGVSLYGQASEPKLDGFSQRIALSKAMRNGFEKLIHKELKLELLREWYLEKYKKQLDKSQIQVVGEFYKIEDDEKI